MSFDIKGFERTKFKRNTEDFKVEVLKDFFAEDEEPVFIMQGLRHDEIAACNAAIRGNDNLKTILQAAAHHKPSIKKAIGDMITGGVDVPEDTQKRIMHLTFGSVKPKINEGLAVKLAETFPVEFIQMTDLILKLTGEGMIAVKKPKRSGSKIK